MNTTDTAQKAQETASQMMDQARTLVAEARSSELAGTASDVAQQVVEKARDLTTELAVKTGRKKPGTLSRIGSSLRNHPVRFALGTAAVGALAFNLLNRRKGSAMTATSGAPAYGESTPGYRTQGGTTTDQTTETSTDQTSDEVTPLSESATR